MLLSGCKAEHGHEHGMELMLRDKLQAICDEAFLVDGTNEKKQNGDLT